MSSGASSESMCTAIAMPKNVHGGTGMSRKGLESTPLGASNGSMPRGS